MRLIAPRGNGVARIWCQGARRSRRRRREHWGAERGGVWGKVSAPQPTTGFGRASWAPPARSGAEPRPLSHILHILGHRTLLVARKILRASNSRGGGGTCPSAPCLATPLPRGGECSRPPRVPRAGEQCGMHSFEGRLRYDWLVHVIPPQQNAPFHERSFVSINRRFLGHTGDCPKWHLDRFSRFAQLTLLRSLSNDPLNFKTRCNFVQF